MRYREPGTAVTRRTHAVQSESEQLREQGRRIIASGALGRSGSYARLLNFLIESAVAGRIPKELEIAMEVFGKGADFDPSQDSMVRVYAHNLRQKLEHYGATDGRAEERQLTLARGEYRMFLTPTAQDREPPLAADAPASSARASATAPRAAAWRLAAAAFGLLVLGALVGFAVANSRAPEQPAAMAVAGTPIWSGLFDDDLPILVVVGDYYIFGERDENGDVVRLVRDFAVDSRQDLDDLIKYHADLAGRYQNLDLTYLPTGSAYALLDVLRVLYTSGKPVHVVPMSEMSDADFKSSHVVYLGYLSALGKLEEFVFASSSLAIGYTYDELRDVDTGDLYSSEAGIPEINRNYRDFAFISTFPGPGGNQFVIVAGMRDAGLMEAAHALSDPIFSRSVEEARPDLGSAQPPAFEMLYEVTGYGRTNLDAMLVHSAKLNYQEIWGGNLLQAGD
jgi:hypothetical protein